MNRRGFITSASLLRGYTALRGCQIMTHSEKRYVKGVYSPPYEMKADVIIIGGCLRGCAAALACCRNGLSVMWLSLC